MDQKRCNRIRRHKRIRKKIIGSAHCPRLCVYRSLKNTSVQLIDDISQKTVLSVSTYDKDFKKLLGYGGNIKAAVALGQRVAERAKNKKITKVVFDHGGFLYHGRIKAVAESARKHGLSL